MKAKHGILIGLVLAAVATMVRADTLILRSDFMRGAEGSHTLYLLTPDCEVIAWGIDDFESFELGKLVPVYVDGNTFISAGGYVSYWSVPQQWYVEPWVFSKKQIGKTTFKANLAAYIGHGKPQWFSTDTRVLYTVRDRLELGVAGHFYEKTGGVGPAAQFQLSKDTSVYLRSTPRGIRLQVNHDF